METERLLLRPWQDSDAETLFKYASDPEVGPRAGWPPHKSVEESLEIIRTVFSAEGMWAVIWKEIGEPMEQRELSDAGISSAESRQRKTVGQLAFLYVKVGVQSKGIGQTIWKAIEKMHPEIEVWETCTPYFDRRNIHFYINRCGFHAVEFFNEHHPDPNMPEQFDQEDGLFKFEKKIR